MGQYFRFVNVTKEEYVDPWDIGGGAKLWEWCVNKEAGIFPYLLRKSNESGGGDLNDIAAAKYAGRWAGDKLYLVGDYDESRLWEKAEKQYRNISLELGKEYNGFVELESNQLKPLKIRRREVKQKEQTD